jgi:hypothetical protein
MSYRGSTAAFALAVALMATAGSVRAAEEMKYPDWKGAWITINYRLQGQVIKYDPNKPWGWGQKAPLTEEYKAVFQESIDDQKQGGLGNYNTARCLPGGMPHMMAAGLQEYIVTPHTTYIMLGGDMRRIFTDGRPFPQDEVASYQGISIGQWKDTDGDGVYDLLEVETRGPFKGPRAYDASGLPLHHDNESTFHELFYVDKYDPTLLHDVITTYDHALTEPWTVDKTFRHSRARFPKWARTSCPETNNQIEIAHENYFLSGEGLLMPAKKNQKPPDIRYFKNWKMVPAE